MTVKYIIGHWTAGATYIPTNYEKEHYQLLIDNNKKVYFGKKQGTTASTGGMNSITYNIACCGGLEKTPLFYGQVEEFCYQAAKSLKIFNLPVNIAIKTRDTANTGHKRLIFFIIKSQILSVFCNE